MDDSKTNEKILHKELEWIINLLNSRIESYFATESNYSEIPPPEIGDEPCYYSDYVNKNNISIEERKVIALALAYELKPQLLDILLTKNKLYDKPYSEFGGVYANEQAGFIPTIQTALFLLAGDDIGKITYVISMFETSSKLFKNHILKYRDDFSALRNMQLMLTQSAVNYILYGRDVVYEYKSDFPATKIETFYEWSDLVLTPYTKEQIKELEVWIKHGDTLLFTWDMIKKIKPGYRALFYGPPGTGKTLTAALLGKRIAKEVYRIDLSQIVSKYIGETEKNLEKIFSVSEQKDWLLFFDEADALFGKRTNISRANDRYANQETSYLLQRIEDCQNVVILASNLKENIDEAFTRRFQSIVYFPMPTQKERLELWRNGFSKFSHLASDINLEQIADKYEMSGGAIMNAVRYGSLMAIDKGTSEIAQQDLLAGIFREFAKEGKLV